MFKKLTSPLQNNKVISMFLSIVTLLSVFSVTYLNASAAVSASNLMGTIIGYVTQIALYIGIVLLAWGLIQLFMAFKNEDADSKQRAIMVIVAAICLIAIGPIIDGVLSSTGVSRNKSIKNF